MIGLTYEEFLALKPCDPAATRVVELLGGAEKWSGVSVTAAEARAAGCTLSDLLWAFYGVARRRPDIERRLRLLLADYAAHVLHIYEEKEKSDAPRLAITAARQFARGEINDAALEGYRDAAHTAAEAESAAAFNLTGRRAAANAARAAADADADYTADHALDAVMRAGAVGADRVAAAYAAADAERAWQVDRLLQRLSDDEPEDWPLPARAS